MIEFDEAYRKMMDTVRTPGTENVTLADAYGRILAEDIRSDIPMPPFDKSAMDGYACRREDIAADLKVVEVIPAGQAPRMEIGPGQCAKIMTGAMLPEGADCVVMVEHTREVDAGTVRFTGEKTASNICRKGEDVAEGDLLLKKGRLINSADLAVLAAAGAPAPLVYKRLRVGVLATGTELVEPAEKPGPGCIRDSNSYQICSQIRTSGALPKHYGIVGDDKDRLLAAIAKAASENDLIIVSGGVSMGDYDFVPDILAECGFRFVFEKIAIKPGKPTIFGTDDSGKYCCGLPGNPVSAYTVFELLLRPLIHALTGHDFRPGHSKVRLLQTYRRKKADRLEFVPVRLVGGDAAELLEFHGAAHINAMSEADGLLPVPIGVNEIKEGKTVDIRQI